MTSTPSRQPNRPGVRKPAPQRQRGNRAPAQKKLQVVRRPPAPSRKRRAANRRARVKSPMRLVLVLGILLALGVWAGLSLLQSTREHEPYQPVEVPAQALEYYFQAERQSGIPWQMIAAVLEVRGDEPTQSGALRAAWNLSPGETAEQRLAGMESSMAKRVLEMLPRYDAVDAVLRGKKFPLAETVNYDYENSWGNSRVYGGDRKHEGVDIFAEYGTPILSCSDGVVERKGWNDLGGWRVGVRAPDGMYYYYAHMSEFAQGLEEGQEVTMGQVLGYIGDSGYGPQGTTGQFEAHLHFGLYQGKDTEGTEKAFNAYPYLMMWDPKRK